MMSRWTVKPSETPVTAFLISARVVPHMARACLDLSRGVTVTWLSFTSTRTASVSGTSCTPSLPFAMTALGATVTSTPLGTVTGTLPTRDIALSSATRAGPLRLASASPSRA
jgi:hypothetical protein